MSVRTTCSRGLFLFAVALLWCTTSALTAFASSPGGGVDDDAIFELDGNAVNDAAAGDDWGNILPYGGNVPTGKALATSFVTDTVNATSDDIFQGGGSKDTQGIQKGPWLWTGSKPQAKDDITHAYAAAYTLANGDTAIYFGMDRYDNSGDSTAGFWFFQDSTVGLSQAKQGGGFKFTGTHTDGDLLLVADFSVGGGATTINVFKWSGNDATGTLVALTDVDTNCDPSTGSSGLCGIVNSANQVAPWGYTNKSGQQFFAHGEFLEGGIDLNTIFGSAIPCFTTFMAETRSSTSPTATLSDFTPPTSFPLCGISIAKSCDGNGVISNNGNTVTYSWTLTATNTGIGTLYDVTAIDTLPDGVKVNVPLVNDPNSLAAKASVTGTVTFVVDCSSGTCKGAETGGKTISNPLSVTNTADVQAFTGANSTGTKLTPSPDVPKTSSCQASAPGALTVTKHCDATNGGPILESNGTNVVVKVPFTATVQNTTQAGTGEAVNNITMSDVPNATFTQNGTITSLAPGASATVKGYYYPSAVDTGSDGLIAGRYFFTDTLTATGTGSIKGDTITNSGAVSCPICPQGECDGTLP